MRACSLERNGLERSTRMATSRGKVNREVGFVWCPSAGRNSGPPEEASGKAGDVLLEELTYKQSI